MSQPQLIFQPPTLSTLDSPWEGLRCSSPYWMPLGGARGGCTLIDEADAPLATSRKWNNHVKYAKSFDTYLHRFLMGDPPGVQVDHINGNKLDNRRGNLRLATRKQNQSNLRSPNYKKPGGFKGVSWDKSRKLWKAQLRIGGRNTFLGRYERAEDAARAYDVAAVIEQGEFALTNFPVTR